MSKFWIFLIFLIFLVSGCYSPGEESDDMFKPLQWGQVRQIQPGEWQQNKPLTIVERTAEYSGDSIHVAGVKNPVVKNVTLGVNYPPEVTGTFALRWKVRFGVGGGSDEFLIDANDLQQMSMSADQMTLSLVSTYVGVTDAVGAPIGTPYGYSNPANGPIFATAYLAEGQTSTDAPTFTQLFATTASGGSARTLDVPIPKFASAFRILGQPGTLISPFTADVTYTLRAPSGTLDVYQGDEIFGVRLAPIGTGIANFLTIDNANAAQAAIGAIEWSLDL